jgi:hypothetical protein
VGVSVGVAVVGVSVGVVVVGVSVGVSVGPHQMVTSQSSLDILATHESLNVP